MLRNKREMCNKHSNKILAQVSGGRNNSEGDDTIQQLRNHLGEQSIEINKEINKRNEASKQQGCLDSKT